MSYGVHRRGGAATAQVGAWLYSTWVELEELQGDFLLKPLVASVTRNKHEILISLSNGSVQPRRCRTARHACLQLPPVGATAAVAALADRHKTIRLCDDEISVRLAPLDHMELHSQRRAASRGRSAS